MLSIEAYNIAERNASWKLGSRASQAYSPATFEDLNYPVRVAEESQLLRYVDTMHETSDGKYFDKTKYQYSQTEGKAISQVAQTVALMTKHNFSKCIRPWMAPFGAVPAFRIIEAFKTLTDSKNLRVLEIGPGSGYLGALLSTRGFSYSAMDNTQGFYMWQNRLFQAIAPNEFSDWATLNEPLKNWDARVNHFTWWQWATLNESTALRSDIVVCDHAMGEFHPIALRHALRLIRIILQGDGPKLFFFTSPGREHYSDINTIGRTCLQSGMELIFFKNFIGFTVPESNLSKYAIHAEHAFKTRLKFRLQRFFSPLRSGLGDNPLATLERDIPRVDHSPNEPILGGAEIIPLDKNEEPIDYPFLRMAGFKSPLDIVQK